MAEPKLAPAGSKLYCLAHFDNSENNLANPDPTAEVRWGDQTWEEMMIGWYAESTDVGPGEFGSAVSRTERFTSEAGDKPLRVGGLLKRSATRALKSGSEFERLWRDVTRDVPQVDRMCLSVIDGDRVRMLHVAQPPVLNHVAGRIERTFAVRDSALANIARRGEPRATADLSSADGADLKAMSAVLGSSFHLPVVVEGQAGVLSFWSKEPAAFPAVAQALLIELGELVNQAAKSSESAAATR